MRRLALLVTCLASALRAGAAPPDMVRAVVVVAPPTPEALGLAVQALDDRGARFPHRFSDGTLLGEMPAALVDGLPDVPGVTLRAEPQGERRLRDVPPGARAARLLLEGLPSGAGLPEPRPLGGDLVEPLEDEAPSRAKALDRGCARPAATSAYLVRAVAIGILIPESVGTEDTENWATEDPAHPGQDRIDLVVAKIVEGCDTLVSQHPEAALSFTYDVRRAVPIPHEPILHSVPDRNTWISDILEGIGHGAASESAGTFGYVNDLRETFDTDWAAAAFVADDLVDADNGFPPTGFPFAYALLGGPYMVMTYDNDGWGLDRMDIVFRHELGHIFHALDEYASAGNNCSMTSGYLGVPNANNASAGPDPACLVNETCVMRGNATPLACAYSRGQVGIRDTDLDGIPDVRDVPPESRFEDAGPLLVEVDTLTLRAAASGLGLGGESPDAPATYSVNRVTAAETSLDGFAYTPLAADDGSFGGRCEAVSVPLAGLSEGWHDVRIRATNDVGLLEPSPALLRLYVNTDCGDDAGEPADDTAAGAVARPVGSYLLRHCAYDSDWSRFYLLASANVQVRLTQADATGSLDLRLLDASDVEIARASASGGAAVLAATAPHDGTYRLVVEDDQEFETPYTLQIIADCLDDPEEPDSPAPLGLLAGPGTLYQRVLCAADEDRYIVSVQAGQSISATMTFDAALGDLELQLLDPTGAVVASSSTGTGTEAVSAPLTLEGPYAVRVFGMTATDANVYDLTLSASGCMDDEGENDDGPLLARPLVAARDAVGTICGTDADWYAFSLAGRRLVRLQMGYDAAAGNIDLELLDASGAAVLRRSSSPGGTEDITTERLAPGAYTVRVFGAPAAAVRYRLRLEDVDPLLLFVAKDPADALLRWNRSEQECFTLRRHEHVARRSLVAADFLSPVVTLIQEGDPTVPDGDRPIDDLGYRDRGVIVDGTFLDTYLVDPHDCGASLVASTKVAIPSPVIQGIGSVPSVEYVVTLANGGVDDAFGVVMHDDLPREVTSFTVLEIPPGSTDISQPAPAGANFTGVVEVSGISVPAGETRVVRFRAVLSMRNLFEDPIVDNQAVLEIQPTPVSPGSSFETDDPATSSFPDDTRVQVVTFMQQMLVSVFWHRATNVDIEVQDPCGNVLGPADMTSVTCGGFTSMVRFADDCTTRSLAGRFEQLAFGGFPPVAGEYVVRLSYPGFSPVDAACSGAGPDEATVVVQFTNGASQWQTITLAPGADAVEVMRFTL